MKKVISRTFLILIALEGGIALGLVFRISQEISVPFSEFTEFIRTSVYSLFGLVFAVSLIGFLLALLSLFRRNKFEGLHHIIEDFFNNKRNSTLVITAALLIIYVSGQLLIQIQGIENPLQGSFLMLTQPAWLWLILICIEVICLIFVLRSSGKIVINWDFLSILLLFSLLSLTWFGLVRLGFGFSVAAENIGFDVLGNPILGYQVVLAVIAVILFYLLEKPALVYIKSHQWFSPKHFDVLISIFIFLGAVLIWNQSPLNSNPFIGQPRPPNYEIYPVSDALLYDRTAQSLLASGSLQTNLDYIQFDRGLRPAFTTMLAIFHSIGGLGYEDIIPFMIFGSALLPVLIFFLTKTLHNRTSGLLAAILVIIRDYNGQLLENIDAGVHAKMIMSEIPMIMGMILFLLLFMKWARSEDNSFYLPLLSGGVLGFTMLFRFEAILILPVAGLVYLIFQWKNGSQFIGKIMVLLAGIMIVISPWIWRNYHKTGEIYISSPGKLDRIFDALNEVFEDTKSNNSNDASNLVSFEGLSYTYYFQEKEGLITGLGKGAPFLFSMIEPVPEFSGQDKQEPFRLMLDHISNNLIQSVLFLPSNAQMLNIDYLSKLTYGRVDHYYDGILYSPKNYVKSLPYWNQNWDGEIPSRSVLPLELNLMLLSIGFLSVTNRFKPGSWILILFFLSFIVLFSLVKQSGGRVVQKVDWIILIYYCIGIVEVLLMLGKGLKKGFPLKENPVDNSKKTITNINNKHLIYIVPMLFFLGSIPPLAELLTPNQYPEAALGQRTAQLLDFEDSPFLDQERKSLTDFIDQGGQVVYARALYPQFVDAGESFYGATSFVWGGLERDQSARTEFYLAGTEILWGILFREEPPVIFPHGSDVIAIGCEVKGSFDTVVVVIYTERGDKVETILWRDGAPEDFSGCPLSTP